jgi:RimJ/RimL family protein N-acetyltransferase
MDIPTLTHPRFVLRALREGDVPALKRIHSNPDVMRYLRADGQPETEPRQAWEYIAMHLGHWHMKGYGKWALADPHTDELIGRVGYYDPPYDWPGLELGWTLAPDQWGKGLATEAALVALRWGFEVRGFDSVISAIHPDNAASRRVAERLGEQRDGESLIHGKPCLIYRMSKERWQQRAAT